ncbi:MAG: hypothetical protein WCD25_13685, partial [Pseudolabrys sp.]
CIEFGSPHRSGLGMRRVSFLSCRTTLSNRGLETASKPYDLNTARLQLVNVRSAIETHNC